MTTVVPPPSAPAGESTEPPAEYLSRDLQWLAFNERVLAQALDDRIPLLERVRFLSIFTSNLDEFFMKRVGSLRRQVEIGVDLIAHENVRASDMLWAIRERVATLIQRKWRCFREQIVPALEERGIQLVRWDDLDPLERASVQEWFAQQVFPLLTPLAVDPGHRFPFISNLSVSLGIMLRRPDDAEPLFARLKVPEVVPQWHRVGPGHRYVSLVEIVENNLGALFPGMEILEVLPFRVTRSAEIEPEDGDPEDLIEQIQQQLKERRFAPVVRLQMNKSASRRLHDFLCEAMEIEPRDVYVTREMVNFRALDEIADIPGADLHWAPWTPVVPPRLRDRDQDIFAAIRQGDILVHHPYESFEASVERFVEAASRDPHVLGIKMCLYRTSGDSPFVHCLMRAAEEGKQVAALVEVRARFDEARNIHWATKLEETGVHVAYGVVGLKTHTKCTLVVRREGDGLRSYAHIGTGNYHSRTARLYEDVGLLTCDRTITGDVVDLFNFITGRSTSPVYERLLVAPHHLKRQTIALIEREIEHATAGRPARIVAKMNQLQDRDVIQSLYRASRAGVRIDLVVRGFCTLRPGVPGLSDNIRVVSVIGRLLEHSRIFWFANGADDPLDGEFLIGSADWMYRNLEARVEVLCPIAEPSHRARLWSILEICLADRRQAWDMRPDGGYVLRRPTPDEESAPVGIGTHQHLMNLALESIRREG